MKARRQLRLALIGKALAEPRRPDHKEDRRTLWLDSPPRHHRLDLPPVLRLVGSLASVCRAEVLEVRSGDAVLGLDATVRPSGWRMREQNWS